LRTRGLARGGPVPDEPVTENRGPGPKRYEVSVRGSLGETIRSAFPCILGAEMRGERTVLTIAADQAALYGVLAQAEALGLELLEVRPLLVSDPQGPPRNIP
ncbi:MAG: hypothetical protein ACRDL8_07420, partial [Solirubrobacteraceae bacterium]